MEDVKNNQIYTKEEKLYLSLIYYRLKKDLEFQEEKIKKNSPKEENENENAFKRGFKKGIVNPILKTVVKEYEETKKKIESRIDLFNETYGNSYDKSEEELKELILDFFQNDKNNEARCLMTLRIACGNEFEYVDSKRTLEAVSLVFYNDKDKMNLMAEALKNNYYKINKKDLRDLEKNMWVSLGLVTAASLIFLPLGGASILCGDFVLALATASTVGALEISKNEELKKQFREIKPDDLAMKFAIKATIIEQMKKDQIDIKDYLDDALIVLGDYRADSEYLLIVEGKDEQNSKKKISICNNLSSRLVEISLA